MFFFFFQAEDGIRDIGVTGVQTCALPIYCEHGGAGVAEAGGVADDGEGFGQAVGAGGVGGGNPDAVAAGGGVVAVRSEERRGGKEGKTRGSPDHLKKKKKIYTY